MCRQIKLNIIIDSFRMRDNSVHLHECSPFWVGNFIIFKKTTILFDVEMHIMIGKALTHLYVL